MLAVAVRQLPTAAAALQAATAAGTQAAEWVEGADGVPAPSTPHSSPRITQLQPQVISERAGEKSYSATGLPSGRSSRASLASSVQQSYSTDDEAGMTFVGFLAFLVSTGCSSGSHTATRQLRGLLTGDPHLPKIILSLGFIPTCCLLRRTLPKRRPARRCSSCRTKRYSSRC